MLRLALQKWLRRPVVYMWAVMRHFWALLSGFLGGFIVSVPAWLIPILPKEKADYLQNWAIFAADPDVYFQIAKWFLVGGVLLASFLAWNEEHEHVLKYKPDIKVRIVSTEIGPDTNQRNLVNGYINLEILNGGEQTALANWRVFIKPVGQKDFLRATVMRGNRGNQMLHDPGNLLTDDRVMERGGRRRGWLFIQAWYDFSHEAIDAPLPGVRIEFSDVWGNEYNATLN
jgi:hypothetical protein